MAMEMKNLHGHCEHKHFSWPESKIFYSLYYKPIIL